MIDFLKFKKIYFIFSAIIILSGIFSISMWGFRYSIDFTGGTNLEYQFSKVQEPKKVIEIFKANGVTVVESRNKRNIMVLKTKAIDEKKIDFLKNKLEQVLVTDITVLRAETVGPVVGAETLRKTSIATILAVIGILLYVAYAFKNFNFAIAGIIALTHDVLVVVGLYSIFSHFFGAELDMLFVTALLTTMSFSVHDTIIVFDQIREYIQKEGRGNIYVHANRAFTITMVRSLNNSMTILFMLISLVLLGGNSIRFFVFTLLIGTIIGTYSSPFIATPILVWLESKKKS